MPDYIDVANGAKSRHVFNILHVTVLKTLRLTD